MNVVDLIKKHEGLRLVKYLCPTGYPTIGYGHRILPNDNITDNGITLPEAERLLSLDILAAKNGCRALLQNWDSLNDVRQAVMIDLCFNLGIEGLSRFRRMLKWIRMWEFAEAAEEMLDSLYAVQVGNRARENARMLRTGEWI